MIQLHMRYNRLGLCSTCAEFDKFIIGPRYSQKLKGLARRDLGVELGDPEVNSCYFLTMRCIKSSDAKTHPLD